MLSCTHEAILHISLSCMPMCSSVRVCHTEVRDVVPRYKPVIIQVLQCYRVYAITHKTHMITIT